MPSMTFDPPPTGADNLFGEIAVRLFFLSRRDLDRAVRAQGEAREEGGSANLGEVLVGLNLLNESQVQAVLRAQEIYDQNSVETLYGRLAVKNGFVNQNDLDRALVIQDRTGRRLRIGEILIKKGFLSWDQHEGILRAQERLLGERDKKPLS